MTTLLRETLVFEPRFIEGSYNKSDRTVDVVIITEGLGNKRDKHFYSNEVLRRAVAEQVFEGAQAYSDHPSKFDDNNRPERSVRDLIGYYDNVRLTTIRDGKVGAAVEGIVAKFHIQKGCDWVEGLIETSIDFKSKHPGKTYTGISINADGDAEPTQINGQEVRAVTHISEVISADVVTKPARGGTFIKFAESARGASHRRKAMKAAVDAATRLEKIAEGESVEPKELLAIAQTLREAGGGKCKECGHMHEGKACDAKDCECESFKPMSKESRGKKEADDDSEKTINKDMNEGEEEESDGDGEDEPDDDGDEPQGKKKESTDTGDGPAGDKLTSGKRESQSIAELRRQNPTIYAAALKEAERTVGNDLVELRRENAQLKAQIALAESRETAKRKLAESRVPENRHKKLLIEMWGASPQEMDAIIEADIEANGTKPRKTVEGAGPRDITRLPIRESDVDALTRELTDGIGEVA